MNTNTKIVRFIPNLFLVRWLQIKQKGTTLLAMISILCSSMMLNAQEEQTFRFGLAFAPMTSWLKSDNTDINSGGLRFAFSYGFHADIYFAPNYAFSTGFYITHNGGKFEDRIVLADMAGNVFYRSKEVFSINYLDLPLTVKLKTNEIGYMTYWGNIGVTPSVRIRARDTFEEPLNGVEIDNQNIIKDDNPALIGSNVMNLSLTLGAGVEFAISGRTAILAGIIFNNGFVNVLDDNDNEKTVLRNLGIRAGLLF